MKDAISLNPYFLGSLSISAFAAVWTWNLSLNPYFLGSLSISIGASIQPQWSSKSLFSWKPIYLRRTNRVGTTAV